MLTMQEQLKAEVEKQDWFILSNGLFDPGSSSGVHLKYKDKVCSILMYWVEHKGTFLIQENERFAGRHRRRPKTVEAACEVICNIYSEAIERWDEDEERQRQEEITRQKRLQERKETIKAFGLSLQSPILQMGPDAGYNEEFIFQASQQYQIQFVELRDKKGEPQRFCVQHILGKFTMEQIKNLINVMAECPQVMADRLLNGK